MKNVLVSVTAIVGMALVNMVNGASTSTLLAHRWSFNGDYTDSAGGLTATPTGSVTFSADGKLKLPGGNKGAGNVDLGENALSVGSDSVTIEIWAKKNQVLNWSRLFEYYSGAGEDKNNDLYMAWNQGTNGNTDKLEIKSNGTIVLAAENSLQPYTLGTMYHISLAFRSNGDGSTTVSWAKRNTVTGAVEKSGSQTIANWTLTTFHQHAGAPRLRLGCSLWGEADPNADYDEVRVWRGELSSAQLDFNACAGPDRLPFEVETYADGMPDGQLAHRWSFNGNYNDSIGGVTAVPTGSPTLSTADQLVLPGGGKGTANVALGANVLAFEGDCATIEIWAQQNQALTYARLFEYYAGSGGDKKNDMYMAWNTNGNNINTDKLEAKSNGVIKFAVVDSLQPYTLGTMYHISMSFQANGDGSTTVTWAKRNSESGAVEKTGSQRVADWTLGTFHQYAGSPVLRLGDSLWGESDPSASYDEVRIWNTALSADQLSRNAVLGADTLPNFYSYCAVARWTGAGVAGKLDDPDNWACTDQRGQAMSGALPSVNTKVVFTGDPGFDIPASVTLCCAEVEFDNATLAADRDWRGIPSCVKLGGYVNLNGHKLFIATLAGSGTIDDVSADVEHPGELHVDVAADISAAGEVRMVGNLKYFKEGAGALTLYRTSQTYTGGTLVAGGTLKLGASTSAGSLGPDNTEVWVGPGSALDANGTVNNYNHPIVLNGGTLMNSVYDYYAYQKFHFGNVRLEADSHVHFQSGGMVGPDRSPVTLDLKGHVLHWWGRDDRNYLWNADITAGTIELAEGCEFTVPSTHSTRASGVSFVIKGQFLCENEFLMGDYICEATQDPGLITYDTADVKVYGTFRPKTDYFWGCTLLNGARLDLSDRTEAWNTTSAITLQKVAKVVQFADNAAITVVTGERALRPNDKLIAWDAKPDNADSLRFVIDGKVKLPAWVREDGVYVGKGGMAIIIK